MGKFSEHLITTRENLEDAGCSEEFIQHFLELENKNDETGQMVALTQYRKTLLDDLN